MSKIKLECSGSIPDVEGLIFGYYFREGVANTGARFSVVCWRRGAFVVTRLGTLRRWGRLRAAAVFVVRYGMCVWESRGSPVGLLSGDRCRVE